MKTNPTPDLDQKRHRNKKRQIIVIDGAKGGVGKSLVASVISSILLAQGAAVTLIELDRANPDIARRFQNHAPVLLADLSDRDGWISLLGALELLDTQYIVMSMPAGLNGVEEIHDLLGQTLSFLNIELNVIFCLSRQNDSITLLDQSLTSGLAEFAVKAVALKNGFFGKDETFDRWRNSAQRQRWQAAGHTETYFPELHHQLIDLLETHPQPLHLLLASNLPIVLRLELGNWLQVAQNSLEILFDTDVGEEEALEEAA